MKKLRIEDLTVDSFVTNPVPQARGTVEANEATALCTTICTTAGPACQPTSYASCATSKFCC
jgi:hypothetical protein